MAETGDIVGVLGDLLQIDREGLVSEVVHAQTGLGDVPVSCGMLDHGGRGEGCRGGLLDQGGPIDVGAEEAGEEGGDLDDAVGFV